MNLVHFTCKSWTNLALLLRKTSEANKYIKPNYDLINRNLLFRGMCALAQLFSSVMDLSFSFISSVLFNKPTGSSMAYPSNDIYPLTLCVCLESLRGSQAGKWHNVIQMPFKRINTMSQLSDNCMKVVEYILHASHNSRSSFPIR